MKTILRIFKKDDLEQYSKWRRNINAEQYMSRWLPYEFNGNKFKQPKCFNWYIISYSGLDVGTVWIEKYGKDKKVAKLGIIIGKKAYWNKGIGKNAIEQAISRSKRNLKFKTVCLNVRNNNLRAISCYKSCGFSKVAEGVKTADNGTQIEYISMERHV